MKLLKYMWWLTLAIGMALSLSACGDDKDEKDDDNDIVTTNSEIVGKWIDDDGDGTEFKANGQAFHYEARDGKVVDVETSVWSYKNNILIEMSDNGDVATLMVKYVDDRMMILREFEDGDDDFEDFTLYKVKKFPWE